MIAGKCIGGVLGALSGGPVGAVIGLLIGHFFDKSLSQILYSDITTDRIKLRQLFFETAFSIMGHLAKADGRISQEEINQAEALMARYDVTGQYRQQAIRYFQRGAQPDFNLEDTVRRFVQAGGKKQNLPVLLLEFLVSMTLADGRLHPAQERILTATAHYLGFSQIQYRRLLAMFMAQQAFHAHRQHYGFQGQQSQQTQQQSITDLRRAYQALGIDETANDREIKRAYRKLMSQHHPDKLMAEEGVPEEVLRMATEKSQDIQAAYDLIKKSRQ